MRWFILTICFLILSGSGCSIFSSPEITQKPTETSQEVDVIGFLPAHEMQVPVLMYHHIVDRMPAHNPYGLFVSKDNFRSQMQALKDGGWVVVPMEDLIAALDGSGTLREKSVVITFDDGNRDTYTNAFPVLREFGYPATVFLMTGPVDNKSENYISWEMAQEFSDNNWTIEPHTRYHHNLTQVTPAFAREEVSASIASINRELDTQNLSVFAYPHGAESSAIRDLLEDLGISYSFTIREGVVTTSSDPLALPRVSITESIVGDRILQRLDSVLP